MACKLTSSITSYNCEYQVAGVARVYAINFSSGTTWTQSADSPIISAIKLDTGAFAYQLQPLDNTASWTDDLAVNGNGGKYRTHTVNLTLSQYDVDLLKQADPLSLGKFTFVLVDKSGKCVVLGRKNGLSATSFNYASGAADADANGWTGVFAGTETEVGQLLLNEKVVSDLVDPDPIIIP